MVIKLRKYFTILILFGWILILTQTLSLDSDWEEEPVSKNPIILDNIPKSYPWKNVSKKSQKNKKQKSKKNFRKVNKNLQSQKIKQQPSDSNEFMSKKPPKQKLEKDAFPLSQKISGKS